ncbi:uncharacterized protein [Channa argus]|uniref:uncharacterized protein isoform X3 n=1 Tax=Channa argus TaxID=215402 RepID=UPI003521166B
MSDEWIDRNTMVELRLIKVSLFLILMLQFKAATGQDSSAFTVRDEDDVTLPCGNVRDDQEKCNKTTWLFSGSGNTAAVSLVELGKIKTESKSKSDRLSVTENCSLVIKKVTDEDVGRYTCRQFNKSGQQQGSDSVVVVSVVTMTEHKDDDKVTLNCSVLTHGHCGHTVKWLYDHNKNEFTDTETPQSSCSVTVTLTTSDLNQKYSDLLKCEVTDGFSRKVHQFTFRRPSGFWWVYIIVAVVLTTLLASVFVIMRLTKTKGKERQMDGNMGLSINPAETQCGPETNGTTDPEEGVCYITINFTKKTDRKVQGDDDDEGEAVTYSTVKASSSAAAAASTDPSSLYATIS